MGYRFADADLYQQLSARSAGTYEDPELERAIFALGLAGESGEVADLVKKYVGHGHDVDRNKLVDELGDVAWYLAMVASVYDIELSTILEWNLTKLRARYPDGFSTERSINREA